MPERRKNLLFFLCITVALLAIELCPSGFLDPDGYYHSQMAQLLASGHFLTTFPWLSAATWATSFADQHLLFHILLIPFVKLNPIVGAQIFNVISGVIFAAIFYYTLKSENISCPKLWTLFCLFGPSGFLLRISLVKATALSLCLMFLFIHFLKKSNPKALFLVSLVFVWVYGGFVFLPVILALYLAAWLAAAWLEEKKLTAKATINRAAKDGLWSKIFFPALGMLLGLLLFPHFWNLLVELYNQIFRAGLGYKIPVGTEWNRPSLQNFIAEYGFVLFFWLITAVLMIIKWKKQWKKDWMLFYFFLSLFFLMLSIKSQRFIEDAAPFMVLFTACALQPFLDLVFLEKIKAELKQNFWIYAPVTMSIILAILIIVAKDQEVAIEMHRPIPIVEFQGASQYLLSHSKSKAIVFNAAWDSFPQLFFLNPQNYYVIGMDSMFVYIADQKKYWLWRHISDNDPAFCPTPVCTSKNSEPLADIIKNGFQASYVILQKGLFPGLNAKLKHDNRFSLSYEDNYVALYRLNSN